jgi:hypothetical protein
VRIDDRAQPFGMPVIGEELTTVAVQDSVHVARLDDPMRRSVLNRGQIGDRVSKGNAQRKIGRFSI